MGGETVMGVNVAARVAFLGVVGRPCIPILGDEFTKVVPPTNVDEWERLGQFGQQVVVTARGCKAVCVAFTEPRRANQWAYSDAHERASLQTAAALALRAEGIEVLRYHPKTAASALGFNAHIREMDEGFAGLLKIKASEVTYWSERLPAFEVAAAVAMEKWP
ncbi:MAG TPA: hypothetical protein VGP64_16340 [Polyangia bacterium]